MIAEALLSDRLALAGCAMLLACLFVMVGKICSLLDDDIDGDEELWQRMTQTLPPQRTLGPQVRRTPGQSRAHVHEAYRDTPSDAAPAKTAAYARLAANDRSPPLSQVLSGKFSLSDQSLHIQGRRSEHQDPAHRSARRSGLEGSSSIKEPPEIKTPRRDRASFDTAAAITQGAGSRRHKSSKAQRLSVSWAPPWASAPTLIARPSQLALGPGLTQSVTSSVKRSLSDQSGSSSIKGPPGIKTPKSRRPRRDDASAPNALSHARVADSSHHVFNVYGLQGQANHRGASSGKAPVLSSGSRFYAHVLRTRS